MHRRNFLSSLNTLSVGMFLAPRAVVFKSNRENELIDDIPLRIAIVTVTNAPVRGLEMGKAETLHAASLLKRKLYFTDITVSDGDVASGVNQALQQQLTALIGVGDFLATATMMRAAHDAGVVFVNTTAAADELRAGQCTRSAFHVCASDRMKRDAMALSSTNAGGECVAWHSSLTRYGADTLNSRFRTQFHSPMTERDWNDWFAIKVLWESFLRARSGSSGALLAALESDTSRFDGHKGKALSFRSWDHQLRQPLYVISGANSDTVEEVPAAGVLKSNTADALDLLGSRASDSGCRWTT